MPERVQQRRTRGWRKPEGAIACGRGTPRGNPFRVVKVPGGWTVDGPDPDGRVVPVPAVTSRREAHRRAVERFTREVLPHWTPARLDELRGRDLMCWCPPDLPCHVDAILTAANACRPENCPHVGQVWAVTVGTTWQVIDLTDRARPAFDRFHEAIAAGGTIRPATPTDLDTWAELLATDAQYRQARNIDERRAIMCPPTVHDRPMF